MEPVERNRGRWEVSNVGVVRNEFVGCRAVTREANNDGVVRIAAGEVREFGLDPLSGGLGIRQLRRNTAQRVRKQRIQHHCVPPRAAKVSDLRRLVTIDPDKQASERHDYPSGSLRPKAFTELGGDCESHHATFSGS